MPEGAKMTLAWSVPVEPELPCFFLWWPVAVVATVVVEGGVLEAVQLEPELAALDVFFFFAFVFLAGFFAVVFLVVFFFECFAGALDVLEAGGVVATVLLAGGALGVCEEWEPVCEEWCPDALVAVVEEDEELPEWCEPELECIEPLECELAGIEEADALEELGELFEPGEPMRLPEDLLVVPATAPEESAAVEPGFVEPTVIPVTEPLEGGVIAGGAVRVLGAALEAFPLEPPDPLQPAASARPATPASNDILPVSFMTTPFETRRIATQCPTDAPE